MIGQTILQYVITDKLGQGGMGVVYLATDTKLNRQVALKFLPEMLAAVPEARARFQREARAQAALSHPNVVTIHDVAEHDGHLFIVMEHIDGIPLDEYCQKENPQLADIVALITGIAEGLEAAHSADVVHRDLKPANILIDQRGRAKICDFGLARVKDGAQITRAGSTIGTAAYMSPEQAQGSHIDQRTDLFSFGSVVYELLSGDRPFPGEHEAAIIYSIVNEEPAPLVSRTSDVPKLLQRIVARCLEKQPDDRYPNATALLIDLRSLAGSINTDAVSDSSSGQPVRPSIAVLPFANMSADPDNAYFSDGLAEELINALTKIPELQVAARTSSFAFKGRDMDIREIGAQLNVATVLEGSVRRAGKRLRITAQLINVADGYHLWSERYDREMDDVFAIQDEISQAIVAVLKVKLIGTAAEDIVARPTENVEAYHLYLRGRHFWNQRTEDGFRKSIDLYEQALKLDTKFALAHVGLADSWSLLCAYHVLSPADSLPQAKDAAAGAMSLNANLAEAYEASAHVRILEDTNWQKAEEEFRKAIALNPAYATAHQRLALLLTLSGRLDEAWSIIQHAQMLEPMALIISGDVALIAFVRRDFEHSIRVTRQLLEINPNFAVGRLLLGVNYEQLGDYQKATAELHRAQAGLGKTTVVSGFLGHAYARWGNSEEAQFILDELQDLSTRRFVSSYTLATIHLGLGDSEKAMQMLQKAAAERSSWLIHLHMSVDPRLDPLRDDPNFVQLMRGAGLSSP